MKTIKAIILVLVITFTFTSVTNYSFAISPDMKQAIENSKKVEAKKLKYEKTLVKATDLISKITNKYISLNKEELLIEKYENILVKLEKIKEKSEKDTSIYRGVTLDFLDDIFNLMDHQMVKLNESIEKKSKNSSNYSSWEDPKKTEDIVEKTNNEKQGPSEQFSNFKKLEENGVPKKEAVLLSFQTEHGDWFKFCANFPADVYTNDALRNYEDSQSDVADAYKGLKNTYYKNYYTDRMVRYNSARIQRCVRQMYVYYQNYGIKQSDVKVIYEKHFGKYVEYTTPFYLEGVQPEDIEEYIENHHEG